MKKKNGSKIWGKVCILLGIVLAIVFGGYLFLDKIIIPKYFGQYGIYGMGDLLGVVNSLYKNPNEGKLITNGWSENDWENASNKLEQSGYLIDENGDIIIEGFKDNASAVELTDREFAASCNKLIESGLLSEVLPNLNYINLQQISILQVNINLKNDSLQGDVYSAANINFIAKIDTTDVKKQISTQMETPQALLDMIIPKEIYLEVSYDIDLKKSAEQRIEKGVVAINGRTAKQSEILINLLIDFIFPPEEEMNMQKFTNTFGEILLKGIDELGDFQFKIVNDRSGLLITANK